MHRKLYHVTASHVSTKYALEDAVFAIGSSDYPGRIGYREARDDSAAEYWATMPRFGCGKSFDTPEAAIAHLLRDNGCYSIVINGKFF